MRVFIVRWIVGVAFEVTVGIAEGTAVGIVVGTAVGTVVGTAGGIALGSFFGKLLVMMMELFVGQRGVDWNEGECQERDADEVDGGFDAPHPPQPPHIHNRRVCDKSRRKMRAWGGGRTFDGTVSRGS